MNLGKVDAVLTENEQVKGEVFKPTDRIKLYIVEVKNTTKGPKVTVSRTHPELVKRLFEAEVTEVRDGTVEIKSIAREAGSRTKIAVSSNNPNVDPVGACVGMNGARVNAIVDELRGEKADAELTAQGVQDGADQQGAEQALGHGPQGVDTVALGGDDDVLPPEKVPHRGPSLPKMSNGPV